MHSTKETRQQKTGRVLGMKIVAKKWGWTKYDKKGVGNIGSSWNRGEGLGTILYLYIWKTAKSNQFKLISYCKEFLEEGVLEQYINLQIRFVTFVKRIGFCQGFVMI